MEVLPPAFYLKPTRTVARALLGQVLCVRTPGGIRRARIVETEAYLGVGDRAAHSFGGRRTGRTEPMFLEGGRAYVYFIYGMHFCLNAVTRRAGHPEAVLIRAVEPLDSEAGSLLTNGPGKLCRYYGIDREDNGRPLFSKRSRVWIEKGESVPRNRIEVTPRIGIDGSGEARDLLLRYHERGNRHVSKSPRKRGP